MKFLTILSFYCFLILSCKHNPKKRTPISQHVTEDAISQPVLGDLNKLRTQLINADTIMVVSHEQTTGPVYDKKKSRWHDAPDLIVDGRVNESLIHERRIVKGKQLEE